MSYAETVDTVGWPPSATSASTHSLSDYLFRLAIVPNGSFFSILRVFRVVPKDRNLAALL